VWQFPRIPGTQKNEHWVETDEHHWVHMCTLQKHDHGTQGRATQAHTVSKKNKRNYTIAHASLFSVVLCCCMLHNNADSKWLQWTPTHKL